MSDRERLALEFLDLLATDRYHGAGDDVVLAVFAEHFTTAEIVELGMTSGHMIGWHGFLHTLDVFGECDPVNYYESREQVGETWAEVHPR